MLSLRLLRGGIYTEWSVVIPLNLASYLSSASDCCCMWSISSDFVYEEKASRLNPAPLEPSSAILFSRAEPT